MKLDDRPVIDQLLNPTPLNLLEEAREDARKDLDERESWTARDICGLLRDRVKDLDLDLSADTIARLDDALERVADDIAEGYATEGYEGMESLASMLEARL